MSKITSVESQKKNPKRFNIFLDGAFAFGADEDLIVDQRLVAGKVIGKEQLDKLLFEASVGKLMERMYRLFSIRQRSEREVRNYFRIKRKEEVSDLAIELLIEKLKQKGLLNDLEFAKNWVEARRKSKQKGVRALKTELYQKGISREIVEEVLSGESNEEELAKIALKKKMRIWQNLPPLEFKKKAYEFLMRRGFEYETVKQAVSFFASQDNKC